ncbi:MAG: hypothetical protein IPO14_08945 [Saprospiraceae bacterium]|nr:hypothetical protein [Saprospiraceae bacterium]
MQRDKKPEIFSVLDDQGMIVLPGIGCFILDHKPATINHLDKKIYPPAPKIDFTLPPFENKNIPQEGFIGSSDYTYVLKNLGEEIGKKLDNRLIINLEELGQLFKDSSHHIHFLKDESSILEGDSRYLPSLDIEYTDINKGDLKEKLEHAQSSVLPIYIDETQPTITEIEPEPVREYVTDTEPLKGFTVERHFKTLPYSTYRWFFWGILLTFGLTFCGYFAKKFYEQWQSKHVVYVGSKATSEYPDTGANFVQGDQEIDYAADITIKPEDNIVISSPSAQEENKNISELEALKKVRKIVPVAKPIKPEKQNTLPDSIDSTIKGRSDIKSQIEKSNPPKKSRWHQKNWPNLTL